ncbi:MAG: hypothetical protein JW833_17050, partial [Prolixibacteraceae bacterium]|nr:hypothetical protein [Prolixibacteraceae bacterium]
NEGENVADTTEYELITFDGKFEAWYSMNDSPAMYRSKEYYESWNKRYVTAWNIKNSQDPFFEPIVGYDYTVDYGFELNHRLFYYFQYVERVLKKTIISGAKPQVALFS